MVFLEKLIRKSLSLSLSLSAKEFTAATRIMQSSSSELSILVSGKV